jgi:hypothetical protein
MAQKQRNDLVDRLVYAALRLLNMALHCFPVNANLRTARGVGDLLYRFDKRHRERALANLRRSFPEMCERQRETIARRSMQEIPMLGVEVLFTTRLVRIDTWAKYVRLENFRQTLGLLLDKNRGLILLTAHYGNFEILGYVLALLGFPTSSIARPLDNQYVSDWLFGVRERLGQKGSRLCRGSERGEQGCVCGLLRPQGGDVQIDRAGGDAVRGATRRRIRAADRGPVSIRRRRAGRDLPRRLEIAGRPAEIHHAAVHQGDRGFHPPRSGAILVGAPAVEDAAEGGGGGGV